MPGSGQGGPRASERISAAGRASHDARSGSVAEPAMEVEEEAAGGAGCAPMELDGDVSEAVAMDADGDGNGDQEPAALVDGDRRARVCLHLWKVRMLGV